MSVDLEQAAWLKSPALYALATPTGVAWGAARANDVEFTSPIDSRANALTEAGRTAALLGGPNVKDRVIVKGRRRDLLFKCVTVLFGRLGYVTSGTPRKVFVIGVAENENGTSSLTVIRSLV
jgi:hypothetical protein